MVSGVPGRVPFALPRFVEGRPKTTPPVALMKPDGIERGLPVDSMVLDELMIDNVVDVPRVNVCLELLADKNPNTGIFVAFDKVGNT